MRVIHGIWFVVSLPFRVFFWLIWQIRRGSLAFVNAVIRRIGQRNTMVALCSLCVLFGVGLITGLVDCSERSRGCWRGAETLEGLLFVGLGLAGIVLAIRHVPATKAPPMATEDDAFHYRAEDWELSWTSFATVVFFVALLLVVLFLTGRL